MSQSLKFNVFGSAFVWLLLAILSFFFLWTFTFFPLTVQIRMRVQLWYVFFSQSIVVFSNSSSRIIDHNLKQNYTSLSGNEWPWSLCWSTAKSSQHERRVESSAALPPDSKNMFWQHHNEPWHTWTKPRHTALCLAGGPGNIQCHCIVKANDKLMPLWQNQYHSSIPPRWMFDFSCTLYIHIRRNDKRKLHIILAKTKWSLLSSYCSNVL